MERLQQRKRLELVGEAQAPSSNRLYRPKAVQEDAAKKILEAIHDARRENAELHEAYQRYLDDWEHQRHDAGEEAFTKAIREALEAQHAKTLPAGYAYYGGWSTLPQPVGVRGAEKKFTA